MFESIAADRQSPITRIAGPISILLHAAAGTSLILAALWRVGEPGEPPINLPPFVQPEPLQILGSPTPPAASPGGNQAHGPDAIATAPPAAQLSLPQALPLSQNFSIGTDYVPASIPSTGTATFGSGSGPRDGIGDSAPCTVDCEGDALSVGVNHVVPPTPLFQPSPPYPEPMRHLRAEGAVLLRAVIGLKGDVEDLRVEKAESQLFADAALAAVSRWRYTPATLNGRRVRVYLEVVVNFRLQ